jgi:hypothetical protein
VVTKFIKEIETQRTGYRELSNFRIHSPCNELDRIPNPLVLQRACTLARTGEKLVTRMPQKEAKFCAESIKRRLPFHRSPRWPPLLPPWHLCIMNGSTRRTRSNAEGCAARRPCFDRDPKRQNKICLMSTKLGDDPVSLGTTSAHGESTNPE